jgi:hypothetical protein
MDEGFDGIAADDDGIRDGSEFARAFGGVECSRHDSICGRDPSFFYCDVSFGTSELVDVDAMLEFLYVGRYYVAVCIVSVSYQNSLPADDLEVWMGSEAVMGNGRSIGHYSLASAHRVWLGGVVEQRITDGKFEV